MVEIQGKYNTAKVFTDTAESSTLAQVETLCNQEGFANSKIRIMPDCHAGKGCTIGTTMTISDKIIPGVVGVDINCGMLVVEIDTKSVELQRLDKSIKMNVPHGSGVHRKPHRWADKVDLSELRCKDHIKWKNQHYAIGSLGSGNHFIELDKDEDDNLYLVIHTGSRNLGLQVANYYQQAAYDALHIKDHHRKDIGSTDNLENTNDIPFDLSYCEGQLFEDYIHDMKIAQDFATINREAISDIIQCGMRWKIKDQWETRHNYIDLDTMILRKGAISAQNGETAIIPMNMRDGSLIVRGKGNPDWNYSAPHGAGRIMSRSTARNSIPMQDYKDSMKGIFTTCICSATVDEAPQAYKPMDEIVANIQDTCDIVKVISPVYNFKAC